MTALLVGRVQWYWDALGWAGVAIAFIVAFLLISAALWLIQSRADRKTLSATQPPPQVNPIVSVPGTKYLEGTPSTTVLESKNTVLFVKDIELSQANILSFSCRAALTTDRLRYCVDYSARRWSRWEKPIRVKLGEIRDITREDCIHRQLVWSGAKNADGVDTYWGDPSTNYPAGDVPTHARLVFIGPGGEEQYHEFLLAPKPMTDQGRFHILSPSRFDWTSQTA